MARSAPAPGPLRLGSLQEDGSGFLSVGIPSRDAILVELPHLERKLSKLEEDAERVRSFKEMLERRVAALTGFLAIFPDGPPSG